MLLRAGLFLIAERRATNEKMMVPAVKRMMLTMGFLL